MNTKFTFKRMILLISLIFISLGMGACGDDDSTTKDASTTKEPVATATTKPTTTKPTTTKAPTAKQTIAPSPAVTPVREEGSLKDTYANDFSIGVAINRSQIEKNNILEVVKAQFNSMTMENEMKPEGLLDGQASSESNDGEPRIRTENLDKILSLAKKNGIKMRGHCLVWHSQTPGWFFREGFEPDGDFVDKETMLKRMESYIKQVIEFCQDNYPGVVYAWDVVNEAVGDGLPVNYRNTQSDWYTVVGEEFIEKAFEYARKYASEDVKLFYNDYNEYSAGKRDFIAKMVRDLYEKGLIDGVGLQSHIGMDEPTVMLMKAAILKYSEIKGIEIQLTELDMHNSMNTPQALQTQGVRYAEIFKMLLELDRSKQANITNVTFWGLTDETTWLTSFRKEKSYPLLFDRLYQPKEAFYYILEAAKQ